MNGHDMTCSSDKTSENVKDDSIDLPCINKSSVLQLEYYNGIILRRCLGSTPYCHRIKGEKFGR
jgi:hypothetical protein